MPRDPLHSAAADFDKARRVDTQAGGALDDALKAFRRGEIVSDARRARLQCLCQRCREASARAAVLNAKTAGLERANGIAGYTSAQKWAGDETWERGNALGTQGAGRRRRRRRHCRRRKHSVAATQADA